MLTPDNYDELAKVCRSKPGRVYWAAKTQQVRDNEATRVIRPKRSRARRVSKP